MLDGEVGEELEEHEPAVDVFVVGAVARPRSAVHDEQLQHFPCNLAKTLALNPCLRERPYYIRGFLSLVIYFQLTKT